eukprot:SAG25_NODE_694_length_5898_cov_2.244525_4_plen_97_part_00
MSALALVCEARRSAAGGFSWGQRREAEAKMDVLVRHGASWGDIHGLAAVRGVGSIINGTALATGCDSPAFLLIVAAVLMIMPGPRRAPAVHTARVD